MKKFVIASVFLFAVSGCAYTQMTLALQGKCADAAKAKFHKEHGSTPTKSERRGDCTNSYKSHYNKKLDECLILIRSNCVKKDGSSVLTIELQNVLGRGVYAFYVADYNEKGFLMNRVCALGHNQFNVQNGFEFNEQTGEWDIVSEASKNSGKNPFTDLFREKFDSWVKPYMVE